MIIVKTYEEAYRYLYNSLPMFQRQGPTAFRKDLINTRTLCELTGNPQSKLKCIHVAGTNGKGSVSHIIAAGLQAQGYRVGLCTSPHYRDFRERIKINGEYIDGQYIVDFINYYHEAFQDIRPSFFELTTVMAFNYFADSKVDFAVIETGLGGRLDSTNVITPLLSVITNISYDHQNVLGDTLPLIAGEKAGIIKLNVPVIIGESQPEVKDVFINKAAENNSKIYFADEILSVDTFREDSGRLDFKFHKEGANWRPLLHTSLTGDYQKKNIITAFAALSVLAQNISIDFDKIWDFMPKMSSRVNFMGRWQILGTSPLIIADSGHNEAGIAGIVSELERTPHQQLFMIMGFVSDKEHDKVFSLLPKDAAYYWVKADIPRAMDPEELRSEASKFDLHGSAYYDLKQAIDDAKLEAKPEDLIFIGGSIYVLGEVI